MKKKFIIFTAILFGLSFVNLSANADYQVTTTEPLYPGNPVNYAGVQPYMPQYNTGYYPNPYQTQCVGQYSNPYYNRNLYGYRNPYGVYNPVTSSLLNGLGSSTTSTAGNIGRSLLYSLVRGF